MRETLSEHLLKLRLKLSEFEKVTGNSRILNSIRYGLTFMIPIILIGSFATVFISLPVPAYQDLMSRLFGAEWNSVFIYIRDGTTNFLSVIMVLCISYSYVVESDAKHRYDVSPVISSAVSLASFVALFGISKKEFSVTNYGVVGAFVAILVAVTSSLIFLKLSSLKALKIKYFAHGESAALNYALSSVIPAAVTIGVYAVFNQILAAVFRIYDVQTFLSNSFAQILTRIQSPFLGALLFILLIHVFWFFGIHGNNVLEQAAQSVFVPALAANQHHIQAGLAPTQIFTKTFFDTFVLMGGCGSALCLVLAVFIFGRNKSQKRIAKLSIVPVLFNINEIILFGIPIVLNPIFLIPFLLVPCILMVTSFAAMKLGLVPLTRHLVEWTTPVFLSGYVSTDSIRGCFLQLFNLTLGTFCYVPFVKIANAFSKSQLQKSINKLYEEFKKTEERGMASGLLTRSDEIGIMSRLLASDLADDLRAGKISVFYQPQVDYGGKIFCAEALLRWEHSTYGFIYPPLIIALAEESHIIDELGFWIFHSACGDMKKLDRLGIRNFSVSVNVTAIQLENQNFMQQLIQILHQNQVSPECLKIEITEQVALASSQAIVSNILSIKELGVQLEMDDFGMGHSSLMYLKEYHFDTIKLDGSLTREICTNVNCQKIISSIVYLSKSIHYAVLAEFVESHEQRMILHSLGCDRYQGYLFSKAVPFPQLVEYILQNANASGISAEETADGNPA